MVHSSVVRGSENENEVLRLHTNLLKIFHDADSSHKGKLKYNEFVKIMQRSVHSPPSPSTRQITH